MKKPFRFEAFEAQISEALPGGAVIRNTKPARVALLVALLGTVVALFAVHMPAGDFKNWLVLGGLGGELGGFLTYFGIELRHELSNFRHARRNFARDLEVDYDSYMTLMIWLRSFPRPDMEQRLTYLRQRQAMTARRFSLVLGSFDKLGIFPVLIAIYFQLKDGYLTRLELWQGMFVFLLAATYVISHWLVGLKLRLDLYVGLFESALCGDTQGGIKQKKEVVDSFIEAEWPK